MHFRENFEVSGSSPLKFEIVHILSFNGFGLLHITVTASPTNYSLNFILGKVLDAVTGRRYSVLEASRLSPLIKKLTVLLIVLITSYKYPWYF